MTEENQRRYEVREVKDDEILRELFSSRCIRDDDVSTMDSQAKNLIYEAGMLNLTNKERADMHRRSSELTLRARELEDQPLNVCGRQFIGFGLRYYELIRIGDPQEAQR